MPRPFPIGLDFGKPCRKASPALATALRQAVAKHGPELVVVDASPETDPTDPGAKEEKKVDPPLQVDP